MTQWLIAFALFIGIVTPMSVTRATEPPCLQVTDPRDDVRVQSTTSTSARSTGRVDVTRISLRRDGDVWIGDITTAQPFAQSASEQGNFIVLFDRDRSALNNDWQLRDVRAGADTYLSLTKRLTSSTEMHVTTYQFVREERVWKSVQTSSTASQDEDVIRVRIPAVELGEDPVRWRVFGAVGGEGWMATDAAPLQSDRLGDCGYIAIPSAPSADEAPSNPQSDSRAAGILSCLAIVAVCIHRRYPAEIRHLYRRVQTYGHHTHHRD